MRSLKIADGTVIELTNATVSKPLREQLRQTACARFSTVLGNGADAYHENHVHIDLMQRTNNYKICPPPQQVPVSPAPGGGGPGALFYHYSSVCSVFRHKPCFPYYLPPIGQYLRLTIVSTDEDALRTENREVNAADDHTLNTIRDMFAALRACWVPPPKDEAHHGMEYTIRFAFKRDGTMIAAPRMTYSSHDVPSTTRDVYRVAIEAALKR